MFNRCFDGINKFRAWLVTKALCLVVMLFVGSAFAGDVVNENTGEQHIRCPAGKNEQAISKKAAESTNNVSDDILNVTDPKQIRGVKWLEFLKREEIHPKEWNELRELIRGTFKYKVRKDDFYSIALEDLDGDGKDEIFIFCGGIGTQGGGLSFYNVLKKEKGKLKTLISENPLPICDVEIVGTDWLLSGKQYSLGVLQTRTNGWRDIVQIDYAYSLPWETMIKDTCRRAIYAHVLKFNGERYELKISKIIEEEKIKCE